MSTDCFADLNKMVIVLYINEVDFKVYSIERVPKGLITVKELSTNVYKEKMVLEYRDLIINNNFTYLYDADLQKFYFKKTMPIYKGTFIIDVIHNKLFNINEKCEIQPFNLLVPSNERFHIEGKYGKRLLH